MNRDHHDALLDQMLRELLGGDRPRDLADRVLARARLYDRVRRQWWVGVGSAIAASAAITLGLWALWPREGPAYPGPQVVEGAVEISNDTDTVQRGSRLVTPDDAGATLELGGYVNIDMAPRTVLTIGGMKLAEKVILEQGELDVNVTKSRGTFDIGVGKALVTVTGTRFQISVSESEDRAKKLKIAVTEGSVVVDGAEGPRVTLAADSPLSSREFDLTPRATRVERFAGTPGAGVGGGGGAGTRLGAMRGAALSSGADGGRPGLLGPNYVTSTTPRPQNASAALQLPPASPPGRGRGGQSALPPAGGVAPPAVIPPRPPLVAGRTMQVVTKPGEVELAGTLRREGDRWFYLDTDNGPVLVFAQQLPPPPVRSWAVQLGKRVKVKWNDGIVQSMVPAEPVPQSGTF